MMIVTSSMRNEWQRETDADAARWSVKAETLAAFLAGNPTPAIPTKRELTWCLNEERGTKHTWYELPARHPLRTRQDCAQHAAALVVLHREGEADVAMCVDGVGSIYLPHKSDLVRATHPADPYAVGSVYAKANPARAPK
jgi:hypothetical protein